MVRQAQLFIDGRWTDGARTYALQNEFDGGQVADVHVPDRSQVETAVARVAQAQQSAPLTAYDRGDDRGDSGDSRPQLRMSTRPS